MTSAVRLYCDRSQVITNQNARENSVCCKIVFLFLSSSCMSLMITLHFFPDSLCYPPCWEGETCDEISGKCVCDPTLREEEICRLRQGNCSMHLLTKRVPRVCSGFKAVELL